MTMQDHRSNPSMDGGPIEAIVAWKLGWLHPTMRVVCGIAGVATVLIGIYIGRVAFRAGEELISLLELCAAAAGVFAVLVALGKFRSGAGIALASCALALTGGAILAEPSLVSMLLSARLDPLVLNGVEIRPFMAAQALAGFLLLIGAAVTVWSRRPAASARFIVRGTLLALPLVLIAAAFIAPAVRVWVDGLPPFVQMLLAIAGFFAGLALASASGHCFIRSLEMGRLDDAPANDSPPQSPRAAA